MDSSTSISDPTDWLTTALPSFSPLENALRCQVCKDFYDTPMITSCSHTFCSLCIRRCLSAEGRCPTCRASEQASKLRRNWAIEEAVGSFQAARPGAMELARKRKEMHDEDGGAGKRPGKRRRVNTDDTAQREDGGSQSGSQRQTRSKSKKDGAPAAAQKEAIEIEDSEDGDYQDEEQEQEPQPEDGLVPCPMCGKRMKEEAVFPHLDRCDDEQKKARQKQNRSTPSYPLQQPPSRPTSTKPQERLPGIAYDLLNDNTFRKKLKELGIPNWGPKPLMIRRHTEWMNLWNSNCDSDHPRTKRELLADLDSWERSQGGHARESTSFSNGVMKKDFDAPGWASSNKTDFSRLIEEARRKAKTPTPDAAPDEKREVQKQGLQGADTDMGGTTPNGDVNPQRPYENNPTAMAAVRARVAAADKTGQSVPAHNENGFGDRAVPTLMHSLSQSSDPVQATDNEAMLSTARFGVDAQNGKDAPPSRQRTEDTTMSGLENKNGDALPGEGFRKVHMFNLPGEPIQDMDQDAIGH